MIEIQKKISNLQTTLEKYKAISNEEINNPEKSEFIKERNQVLFGKIKTIKFKINSKFVVKTMIWH